MANGIKIGNLTIDSFKVGSADCKVYLGDYLLYSGGTTPPTPAFEGKWKATYSDSSITSAECGVSSAISENEITLTNLVSVEIGNCITSIGYNAFYQCSSLTSCTIGSGVTSIGASAFRNCSSLTVITIPDSVTSIGSYTFYQCSGLTSIIVEAPTPPTFGSEAFEYTNNCPIYVPSGSVNTYKSDTYWSLYASRIQAIPTV